MRPRKNPRASCLESLGKAELSYTQSVAENGSKWMLLLRLDVEVQSRKSGEEKLVLNQIQDV